MGVIPFARPKPAHAPKPAHPPDDTAVVKRLQGEALDEGLFDPCSWACAVAAYALGELKGLEGARAELRLAEVLEAYAYCWIAALKEEGSL
jgi:hypothetical protein